MTLSLSDYLLYSVLGMGVVFFALVLLMVIIRIITATIREKETGVEHRPAEVSPVCIQKSEPAPLPAPGTAGDVALYDTDPKTAAMIMAIVADELKTPLNKLRFISIKEVKS